MRAMMMNIEHNNQRKIKIMKIYEDMIYINTYISYPHIETLLFYYYLVLCNYSY